MVAALGNIIVAEMQAMTARVARHDEPPLSTNPAQPLRASVLKDNRVKCCFLDERTEV
jgi:hypothetical protein